MTKRKRSILRKILIPLLVVMLLQAALIFSSVFLGGTVSDMQNNSFDILGEKVVNRKNILETDMVQRWSNLTEVADNMTTKTEEVLAAQNKTYSDITFRSKLSEQILAANAENIIYMLRTNAVTGAFIILDGDGGSNKNTLYLRDSDPNSNPLDYSDLLAEVAPSSITKNLGIAMGSYWRPHLQFNSGQSSSNYYYKPFHAAQSYKGIAYRDLGYWGWPIAVNQSNIQAITYSMPLIDAEGNPYGVLGIEIDMDYLAKSIPDQELNSSNKGGYILGVTAVSSKNEKSQTYIVAGKSGPFFKTKLADNASVEFKANNERKNLFLLSNLPDAQDDIYSYIKQLNLYNNESPFANDQWVLVGAVAGDNLLAASDSFKNNLLITLLITTALGIFGIIIVAGRITNPIGRLAQNLKTVKPDEPINLNRISITEIDELIDSIEHLSQEVVDSAFRLTNILNMVGFEIGVFEYNAISSGKVFCTGAIFTSIGLKPQYDIENYIVRAEFEAYFNALQSDIEEQSYDGRECIYRIRRENQTCWLRVKQIQNYQNILGVITDVTQDVLARKKIEYDRDYDSLSNLYNRRAFQKHLRALFATPETLGISAFVVMDLDNLKFVNDTFGHDYGDEYIKAMGDVLRKYDGDHSLVSRISGDEFVLFFHSYPDRESIRKLIAGIQKNLKDSLIYLPNHTTMQIRASGGIAWYPDDSMRYEDLQRYADFAMYMVKKTQKGEFADFNIQSYNEDSYLLHCREELNTIIEGDLVDFHFQPIVDAKTGDIFGYEALMRLQSENIKTPTEFLSLASSQSKLAQVERLTFFCALPIFASKYVGQNTDCKLFVNSIANQMMTDEDCLLFEQNFAPYLDRLVIEFTEEEHPNEDYVAQKQETVKKWGAMLALDDFGVGYNGESMLLKVAPQFIKLDTSIVQNIHRDQDRYQIMHNLLTFCHQRNIKVIAEGIESREDLATLIGAGIDYLQGYYVCDPLPTPPTEVDIKAEILEINKLINNR